MLYFDKSYLKKYMDTGLKLKVYVNGQYLTITDSGDLSKSQGEGTNNKGEMVSFNYKDVDHVKAGSRVFTLDQLNGNDKDMPDELDPNK